SRRTSPRSNVRSGTSTRRRRGRPARDRARPGSAGPCGRAHGADGRAAHSARYPCLRDPSPDDTPRRPAGRIPARRVIRMATWDDVGAVALALPETLEREGRDGLRDWRVKHGARDKGFVWERPLRKSDLAALGSAAPSGPILGVRVPDVGAKDALIAD